ncbi:aromatic acid exporter family protein [Promicromonospora sp. NPDC019610]|uniref:aromatic acid exporter family protein n=1 Tax=Promicromonospora sp. NPDC019610 TaxID=3364405 RepID=UPI0037A9288D
MAYLHGQWARHPRWAVAVKGATAAALAWFVALLAPAPFAEYPYYAPLGAVVAVSGTAVRSARESAQAVGAVLLGAVIARAVDTAVGSSVLSVALVVAVALLCAGWRVFGDMGTWVATSALFVLVLGGPHPLEFIGVFSGLLVVGAAIGVAINLLLPPLPLTPSELALDRLRDVLVDQLELLAERLERQGPLLAEEWQRRRHELTPTTDRTRHVLAGTRESTRVNRRARRYDERTTAQARRAQELGVAADVVDEIVRLLAEWEHTGQAHVALGPHLRPALAGALRAYAAALRSDRGVGASGEAVAALRRSVDELADAVRATRRSSGQDHFVAGTLVVTLWRAIASMRVNPAGSMLDVPPDLDRE